MEKEITINEIKNSIDEIKKDQRLQAKSMKVINREMGETRDAIQELKLAMIQSDAKLKEELICQINNKIEESKQDRALLHQELGVIKEKLKGIGNSRQWLEKTLIFLLGVCLTIIGFLVKIL